MLRLFKNNKNKIMTAFRAIFGVALALILIHSILNITGGNPWEAIVQANTPLLLTVILIQGLMICSTSYRWGLLLRVQKIYLPLWNLIRLTLIGVFFNLTLPGSVSGDLIKMTLIAKATKTRKTEGVFTIVLDRALGLLGLFIVTSIAVLIYLPFLLDLDQKYRFVQISAIIVGFGSFVGISGIALIEMRQTIMNYSMVSRFVNRGARLFPVAVVSLISRIVTALELYRKNRSTIIVSIALSILVHSLYAINVYLLSRSVGADFLELGGFFLAVSIANTVAAIPLTPGGIGTRDAVLAIFLVSMNAPLEIVGVIPVLMTLVIIFWGFIGGFIFILYKNQKLQKQFVNVA